MVEKQSPNIDDKPLAGYAGLLIDNRVVSMSPKRPFKFEVRRKELLSCGNSS